MSDLFVKMSLCNYQPTNVNILMVGEIASGKSTLINALANYLSFRDFNLALKLRRPVILAPTAYNVADRMGTRFVVTAGNVLNPFVTHKGVSATQDFRTYSFQIWNGLVTIRIIDTPGLGDFRGPAEDNKTIENILNYIGKRFELHAICFVLKPLTKPLHPSMLNYMKALILNLNPKVTSNFVFAFTHTRESFYSMGHSEGFMSEAFDLLEKWFPGAKVPFRDNVFCFENEPFIQLITNKNYIVLRDEVGQLNSESWTISCNQAWKFIHYIVGNYATAPLTPFEMLEKTTINDVRRILNILTQPLVDNAQYLIINIALLLSHRIKLTKEKLDVKEARPLFEVPTIKMKMDSTVYPVVLCASLDCVSKIQVDDVQILFPKTICESPNNLSDNRRRIIGDEELVKCRLFDRNTGKCIKCNCSCNFHMYSYYLNEFYRKDASFTFKIEKITSKKVIKEEVDILVLKIDERIASFKEELTDIAIAAAEFTFFLKTTSVRDFNDSFRDYINYLIAREDMQNIKQTSEVSNYLRKTLQLYDQVLTAYEKNNVYKQKNLRTLNESERLLESVNTVINKVFNLELCGQYLTKLFNIQIMSRENEFRTTVHYKKNVVETQKILQRFPSESLFMSHSNTPSDYYKPWCGSPVPYLSDNSIEAKHNFINQLLDLSIGEQVMDASTSNVSYPQAPTKESVASLATVGETYNLRRIHT
ncbi:unnamed protein product [Brassicogethes aeneus]|uniref:DUF8206 domain-containing protein n=1 Tax=Brassicogethes aeneus TaxID=1431903 RepID=A0A9P0AQ37_BRAAE|nr:unnamed protein product [Brassicogethes aeneus]